MLVRSAPPWRALLVTTLVSVLIATGGGIAAAQPTTTPTSSPRATTTTSTTVPTPETVTPQVASPTTTPATTTPPLPTTTEQPAPSADVPAPSAKADMPAAPPMTIPPSASDTPEASPEQLPATKTPRSETKSRGPKKPAGDWSPTENPNSTVVPGQMRSDREEIPEGFTKADADKAETMEARQQMSRMAAPGCQVYWPSPYQVCGAIKDKYNSLGGPNSFLLWPTTNELVNPDGVGRRSVFQNGPIYWSPWGGAHPVVNHFFAAWARQGYEGGILGYPTTDEIVNPDGIGRRQEFQGAAIYWKLNEAYAIGGAIRDKWNQTGATWPAAVISDGGPS